MSNIDIKISNENLLKWSGMEDWVNGTSSAPTEHTLSGASASVAQESTIVKIGTYSAAVTRSGADATLYHDLDDYENYQGRKVTFGCWVYATVASRARIGLSDGVGSGQSSYHSGVAGWEYLEVTDDIDVSAIRLRVEMQVNTGDTTAYFDNGVLCLGDSSLVVLTNLADFSGRKTSNKYIDQSYTAPRRAGSKTPNVRIDSKSINYDFMVIGATPTAKRTNLDDLQLALNSQNKDVDGNSQVKNLFFYDDRFYKCYIDNFNPEDIAASRVSKGNVKFNMPDPFEYSNQMYRKSQALSGTTSFTVTNDGNAITYPIITVTNSSSNITSVIVENLTSGQKFTYTGTLVTSTDLVIDSENLSVKNNGTEDLGNVTNEIDIILVPGDNLFKVTGVVSGTILIDRFNRWY
jgi:hypothetical protein